MTSPVRGLGRSTGAGGFALLVTAVVLIGLVLRGPIVGVPPLLGAIRADLGLGPATAGLLTSLPLVAFAVLSPFVSGIVRRLGVDRTVLLSLLLLGVAVSVRPWTGVSGLLVGTAVIGVAITIGNVVVPVLVRRDAGRHVASVMAASTGSYGVGQAITVYLAVPIATVAGWRWGTMLPAALVVVALAVWLVRMRAVQGPRVELEQPDAVGVGWGHVWRQPAAWWLALFFGMQSLLFYTASTWIPTQLVATTGMSEASAGTALSVFHLCGIGGTFLVPVVLRWFDARLVGAVAGTGWLAFFLVMYQLPEVWPAWVTAGGLFQGAGFGLALTLVATRPVGPDYGRYVSGMVQGVGYGVAALGPVLIGWVAEVSGGWGLPTGLLVGCAALMAVSARQAGAGVPIGPPGRSG